MCNCALCNQFTTENMFFSAISIFFKCQYLERKKLTNKRLKKDQWQKYVGKGHRCNQFTTEQFGKAELSATESTHFSFFYNF